MDSKTFINKMPIAVKSNISYLATNTNIFIIVSSEKTVIGHYQFILNNNEADNTIQQIIADFFKSALSDEEISSKITISLHTILCLLQITLILIIQKIIQVITYFLTALHPTKYLRHQYPQSTFLKTRKGF